MLSLDPDIFVYMYTYILVCVYTCMLVYMYTSMFIYMCSCVFVYMYTSILVYMYVCMFVFMYTCMYVNFLCQCKNPLYLPFVFAIISIVDKSINAVSAVPADMIEKRLEQ